MLADVGQPPADRSGRLEPDRRAEQHREADQEQAGAVAAVLRVELAGGRRLTPDGAGHPADRVREAHPERGQAAEQQSERGQLIAGAAPPSEAEPIGRRGAGAPLRAFFAGG